MKNIIKSCLSKFGYQIQRDRPAESNILAHQALEVEMTIAQGKDLVRKFSPDLKILNGPFKGLEYPSLDITEYALAPKFFGTYESHLHKVINTIPTANYADILDVGCAEGFYAVGLASLSNGSLIHCYDINEKDLDFCKSLASNNHLDNLKFHHFCSPETLISFPHSGRTLIFCDSEGYEIDLFTTEVISSFKNVDLIIEMHDLLNPKISETLYNRFSKTHNIEVLNNAPSLRGEASIFEPLTDLNPRERWIAMHEHRGGLHQSRYMEWGYFTQK